jgi:hypothetical protein
VKEKVRSCFKILNRKFFIECEIKKMGTSELQNDSSNFHCSHNRQYKATINIIYKQTIAFETQHERCIALHKTWSVNALFILAN